MKASHSTTKIKVLHLNHASSRSSATRRCGWTSIADASPKTADTKLVASNFRSAIVNENAIPAQRLLRTAVQEEDSEEDADEERGVLDFDKLTASIKTMLANALLRSESPKIDTLVTRPRPPMTDEAIVARGNEAATKSPKTETTALQLREAQFEQWIIGLDDVLPKVFKVQADSATETDKLIASQFAKYLKEPPRCYASAPPNTI
ncbi:hypothetical protein ON010_g9704 [Phytophthora cinnamomi]|nr:hypothetical protein ON010_g9704 [Phytophthora cinnamomi]